MINFEYEFDDSNLNFALWAKSNKDSADLAYLADFAVANKIDLISVGEDYVNIIWPWLENKKIKIFSRFYLEKDINKSDNISETIKNINHVFKQGADGAQIFINYNDLNLFVSQTYLIKDDLFFNKELFIGLNICDVVPLDWGNLWVNIRKIRANGLIFAFPVDKGNKSDFVGRLYAAIESWPNDFKCDLHFVLGDNDLRINQTKRLVEIMKPSLVNNLKFFINI